MKIISIQESIQASNLNIISAKAVQIKKVSSIHDMIALKNQIRSLKKAVKIG